MKLQTLTLLFILIIVPITVTVSKFLDTELITIRNQTNYDAILTNSTYDAIEAFQINESNSSTNDITTEKMRDVNASVKSFYNSLASNLSSEGYTAEDLEGFIPCLVYGLYDGYYIYTSYTDDETHERKYGLKPYVYYTERITRGAQGDLTISYTLDNYIIITGIDTTGNEIAKSGYFTSDEAISYVNNGEHLIENIDFEGSILYDIPYLYKKFDVNGNEVEKGQSLKYYHLTTQVSSDKSGWYSYGSDGKLKRIFDEKIINILNSSSEIDNSAQKYLNENIAFSQWVSSELSSYQYRDSNGTTHPCNYLNLAGNNPDRYSSAFNEHRRNVIKESIETNLKRTLYNYRNDNTIEDFEMPEIDETHWDMIINNVSMISFMQGLPLKNKLYAGYSVVTNTQSKEFIDPDEIYIIEGNVAGAGYDTYHKVIWNGFATPRTIKGTYRNLDFKIKKEFSNNIGIKNYYYQHFDSADYESVITATDVAMPDLNNDRNGIEVVMDLASTNASIENAIKAYYTALYRERYVNYKSLNFGYNP